jgi:hypothetical protein
MVVVAIEPSLPAFTIIAREKDTVRLGDRDRKTGKLTLAVMERAISALKRCHYLAIKSPCGSDYRRCHQVAILGSGQRRRIFGFNRERSRYFCKSHLWTGGNRVGFISVSSRGWISKIKPILLSILVAVPRS